MAFRSCDLSVLAYANNFTLWHYRTTDNIDTIGYFNNAVNMLYVGDLMIVNFFIEDEPKTKFYIVTGNDGKEITTTIYA